MNLPFHRRYASYHFIGQRENEVILRIIHRHWFNIFTQFLGLIFIILVLIFGAAVLVMFPINLGSLINAQLSSFLVNTMILFLWIFGFFLWIDMWFDVWIITDHRVINIEQKGLFVREVSELGVDKIQDVTSEVIGVIPSILNYGDVFVQTAGETERFVFHQVPDPVGVKDMLSHIIHAKSDHESIIEAVEESALEGRVR